MQIDLRATQGITTRGILAEHGIAGRALHDAVRQGRVVRLHRGVYAAEPLPTRRAHVISGGAPDPAYLAQVRAALLALPAQACAATRTAAALWGIDLAVEPRGVELAVPWSCRPRSAGPTAVRRRRLEVVEHPVLGFAPVRLSSPSSTVLDIARQRPRREGVVAVDSALRRRLVTVEELVARARRDKHVPGQGKVLAVLALVDPKSGSVLESLCRVLLAAHGLHPTTQLRVHGAPGLIGRVDFAFEEQRVVLECDGRRWHDPDDPRCKDRWRDNELTRAGWRVLRVTWDDVVHSPAYVVQLVRDTLAAVASRAS